MIAGLEEISSGEISIGGTVVNDLPPRSRNIAIVRHSKPFLFDEPLSKLDALLRTEMRIEIKKLHQRLGTTIV